MHTGIKILPFTSLPQWKYTKKSCWIRFNVHADRTCTNLRPAEMPACCFLLSLAGTLLRLPTHDPQTRAVVREMDLIFCCAKFFFANWINWSNRRMSYPSCHAFYLLLIALSFSASLFLSSYRQYLCLLSLLLVLPLSTSDFHANHLQFHYLPSIYFFFFFTLSDHLLLTDC